jgi:hypothetical protein
MDTKWKKGESGNPGGRPKKLNLFKKRLDDFSEEMWNRAKQIVLNGDDRDAAQMLKIMWAYQYGNPTQPITGEDGAAIRLGVVILPAEETEK